MATTTGTAPAPAIGLTRQNVALGLFAVAVVIALARPLMPEWMIDRPDNSGLFPFAQWLDAFFNLLKDLGNLFITDR